MSAVGRKKGREGGEILRRGWGFQQGLWQRNKMKRRQIRARSLLVSNSLSKSFD